MDQKKIDKILLDIAKKHLGVTTLDTRKSDSLDFREQAVWTLKAALQDAFNAGVKFHADQF